MATTLNRDYPYPDGPSAPNNVPYDLQQLAEAVDVDVAALMPLIADTGWLALTSLATGWTAPAGGSAWRVRRVGDQAWLDAYQRNNAGVIAAGSYTVGSLPASVGAPSGTAYHTAEGVVSGGTSGLAVVSISPAGVVGVQVWGNTTGVRCHFPILVG